MTAVHKAIPKRIVSLLVIDESVFECSIRDFLDGLHQGDMVLQPNGNGPRGVSLQNLFNTEQDP